MPLLPAVLTILLFASAVGVSASYVDSNSLLERNLASDVVITLESTEKMWNEYRKDHRVRTAVCDVPDPEGGCLEHKVETTDEGLLPASSWRATLSPDYGFIPSLPDQYQLDYAKPATDEAYLCVTMEASPVTVEVAQRAIESLAVGQAFANSSCGASTTSGALTESDVVKLTYWLKKT